MPAGWKFSVVGILLPTLEGTLTLECSPEELIAESRRLGDFWVASVDVAERKRRRSGWK